jgi:hypothetical protein
MPKPESFELDLGGAYEFALKKVNDQKKPPVS